jgi:Tfp pilus assembly PilM family ATPase
LADYDEISSTEKLLNVIKGGEGGPESTTAPPAKAAGAPKSSGTLFRKGGVVGVELGYNEIRLAKMSKRHQLIDFKSIPLTDEMNRTSPDFPKMLKSALAGFTGRDTEIWAAVPSAGLELRYLKIPRLPRKQISNAVFWTYKKENPFNERENAFDYEMLGDIVDEGVKKTAVLAYSVPQADIDELKNLFNRAGYPLTGITTVPFAFQNMFRTGWLDAKGIAVCNLFIGRNWSRIDVFHDGNVLLSRGIKAGMNSMVEAIRVRMNETLSSPGEAFIIEVEGEEPSPETPQLAGQVDLDTARRIFNDFLDGQADIEVTSGVSVKDTEIFDLILPALDRLVRQVERTLEHYVQTYRGEPVSRIYTTSVSGANNRIKEHISQQLGISVESVDPLAIQAPLSSPRGISGTRTAAERAAFAPAVGLGLSDNEHTPNLLHTYREKDQQASARYVKQAIVAVFVLIMVALGGWYFYQKGVLNTTTAAANRLQMQLDEFSPNVDQQLILNLVGKVRENEKIMAQYGRKYKSMAIVSELAAMTPPNIRLMNVTAELDGLPQTNGEKKGKGAGSTAEQPAVLKIEGLVTGEREKIEPALAQYLLGLQMSPLFGKPNVTRQTFRFFQGQDVLIFEADLEVL